MISMMTLTFDLEPDYHLNLETVIDREQSIMKYIRNVKTQLHSVLTEKI